MSRLYRVEPRDLILWSSLSFGQKLGLIFTEIKTNYEHMEHIYPNNYRMIYGPVDG